MRADVVDRLLDGGDLLRFLVGNLGLELLFQRHHQLDRIERVRAQIVDGDLVKLDVTIEKDGYVTDAARTVVAGRGSELAARLKACAEAAFDAGLAVARAGTPVSAIGRAVDAEVRRHGFRGVAGLCGHGVGRAIHEEPSVPNQFDPRQKDVLTDGLVITIEPMIAATTHRHVTDADGWTIRTFDGSLSAHYEHTLVVTGGAPVVLTAGGR